MANMSDFLLKVVLIGDSGVGKSCLLLDTFDTRFIPTIGVDIKLKTIYSEGKRAKVQIWDTAGEERFRSITNSYYRGATGIIIMYDVTNQNSFDNVTKWIENVEKYASPNVVRLLVGNKCDMESERVISRERAELLASEQEIPFLETSAKTNLNIDKIFETITRLIIEDVFNR